MAIELPVEGFPISDEEIRTWFIDRYHREPGAEELIGIINAMSAREATPPIEDTAVPPADAPAGGATPRPSRGS